MLLLRGSFMSRSYKKVPCCKNYNRGMKKRANRHLRRNYFDIPSGRAYKKLFCSYDICDYRFLRTFSSYKKRISKNSHKRYSDDELYRMWYKYYKMK